MRLLLSSLLVITVAACGGPLEGNPGSAPNTASTARALTAPPSITALNRTGSPPEGGMMILIVGSGLDPSAAVTFDGLPATSVTFDASTNGLVAITPAHPEGFVPVVVTNPDGQSATWDSFHYGPAPVISSVTPGTNIRRGDPITITGANFAITYGVQVSIGGAFPQVLSKTASQIVVAAPKLNQGSYQVVVSNFDSQYAVSSPISFH